MLKPRGFSGLLAVLAIGLTATSAQATGGQILPGSGSLFTSGTSITKKFVSKNGLEVKCTSASGSGETTSFTLGIFWDTWSSCTGALGVKCTGLSDTTGNITIKGAWHWGYYWNGSSWVFGIIWLDEAAHFTCASVLSTMRGCVVGPASPVNTGTTTITNTLKQTKGVNEFTMILAPGTETETACILETSSSGGKFEQSGLETTDTMTFGENVELMT